VLCGGQAYRSTVNSTCFERVVDVLDGIALGHTNHVVLQTAILGHRTTFFPSRWQSRTCCARVARLLVNSNLTAFYYVVQLRAVGGLGVWTVPPLWYSVVGSAV
jgi:hypothetical protein